MFLGAGGVVAAGVLGARVSGMLGDGTGRDGGTRLLGYGAAGVGALAMLGAAIGQRRTVSPMAMRRLAQVAAVSTEATLGAVTATSISTGDIKVAHANRLVDLASIEATMGVVGLVAWGAGAKGAL